MPRDYVTKILKARVYDVARETPLELAPKLSSRLGSEVWLKREDLQPVFSFKLRGAYNKLASLKPEERARGVIASSAGNHAQGVALAAHRLGTRALIVMPETAPRIKVDAVERLGAEVLLAGDTYDGARERAEALAAERGMVLIPPYDDEQVIAGQGTVGMEIVRQQGEAFDAIFVSVGGGGLIAGIAAYIKALWPETLIIGVEPHDTPTLHAALAAGERVVLEQVGTFADGVAVKQIGAEPFRIARECVDEVVLVSTDEICAAIKDIFEDTRSIAEPAGALAVAGLKRYVEREGLADGQRFTAVVSGATSTSTASATSPSGPSSASSGRPCSRLPSRSAPEACFGSASLSASARSPSSTTAMPTTRTRTSSWAWRSAVPGRIGSLSWMRWSATATRCST